MQEFKDLSEGKTWKCDKCNFTAASRNDTKIHMDKEHNEEEIVFKCNTCGFTTNCEASWIKHSENHTALKIKCRKCGEVCDTDEILKDHIKSAHPRRNSQTINVIDEHIHCNKPCCPEKEVQMNLQHKSASKGNFVCRNCKESFENKWQLMNHRRDKHPTNKTCFYDAEDKCSFSANQCWYKHKDNISNEKSEGRILGQQNNELKCFTCQNRFSNTPSLMEHRKQNHIETVKLCSKYEEGKCDRGQKCWYRHGSLVDFHVAQKTKTQP